MHDLGSLHARLLKKCFRLKRGWVIQVSKKEGKSFKRWRRQGNVRSYFGHANFESALSIDLYEDDVSQAGEGASGTDCERSPHEIALRDHVIYTLTDVKRKGELTSSMDKREDEGHSASDWAGAKGN